MKSILQISLKNALSALYDVNVDENSLLVEKTKEEYSGNYTIVVFPLLKWSKKNVEDTSREIITVLLKNCNLIASYNIIKGFLNITIKDEFWISKLNDMFFGKKELEKKSTIMIEFSSPNTNKPLHLGHIRNNLLGDSITRIKEKAGYNVIKVNLINDRGIHICKSMLAWMIWGNKQTPEQLGIKGDKFVGNYYGTPRKYVMEQLESGRDVLLEIDIQGALQIKKRFPEGVFVFIVPPSLDELSARIYKRGTDSEEVIKRRMASAASELTYDYIIVNDIAEKAANKVLTIMEAERYRVARTYFIVDEICKGKAEA